MADGQSPSGAGSRRRGRLTPGARRAVRRAIKEHRRDLVVIGLATVVLAIMPTAKSAFESTIISQIDRELSNRSAPESLGEAANHVWQAPVESSSSSSEDGGIEATITDAVGTLTSDGRLGWVLLAYVILVTVNWIAGVWSARRRARVTRAVRIELRSDAIDRALDPRRPDRPLPSRTGDTVDPDPAGRRASAIHAGSGNLAGGVGDILRSAQAVLALGTAIFAVFLTSRRLAAFLAVFVVAQLLVGYIEQRKLEGKRKDLGDRRDALNARSNDILRNRDLILAHDSRGPYTNALRADAEEYAGVEAQLSWRVQAYRLSAGLIADIGRIGVLVGALLVVLTSKSEVENIGSAYFIVSIYYRMLAPTQELAGAYANYRRARQESEELEAMLDDAPPSPVQPASRAEPPSEDVAIAFRDVGFSYETPDGVEEDEAVLEGCSFQVRTGHTTLLLGRSGAGKTTIARMVLGVVEPSAGEVWVAGERVTRDTDLEHLHARLSYLAQEEHILDQEVRANLFPQDHGEAALVDVLRRVGLPSSARTANSPEELLAKGARKLSGGEKQRLALARVLLDDDPIVIMDEPLVGADAFTFKAVAPQVKQLIDRRERTILIISHRLAFAGFADDIIILEDGRVSESGSREALMRENGVFRQLYDSALAELTGNTRPSSR